MCESVVTVSRKLGSVGKRWFHVPRIAAKGVPRWLVARARPPPPVYPPPPGSPPFFLHLVLFCPARPESPDVGYWSESGEQIAWKNSPPAGETSGGVSLPIFPPRIVVFSPLENRELVKREKTNPCTCLSIDMYLDTRVNDRSVRELRDTVTL